MGRRPIPRDDSRYFGQISQKEMRQGRASLGKYLKTTALKLLSSCGNNNYILFHLCALDPTTGEVYIMKNVEDETGLINECRGSEKQRVFFPQHITKACPGEKESLENLSELTLPKPDFKTGPEAREAIQPTLDRLGFIDEEHEEYEDYRYRIGRKHTKKLGIDLGTRKKRKTSNRKKIGKSSRPPPMEEEHEIINIPDTFDREEANIYRFISKSVPKEIIQKKKEDKLIQFPSNLVGPRPTKKFVPPPKQPKEEESFETQYEDRDLLQDLLSKGEWFINNVNSHQQEGINPSNAVSEHASDDIMQAIYEMENNPDYPMAY